MRLMNILRQNRGGVAILVGLCATVLFGFVALVIDIGYGLVARNELHNVADAASLAATRQLGRIYVAMPKADQINYVLTATDGNDVRNEAVNVAAMNYAAGQNVTVDVNDIEIGKWDTNTKTFTVTDTKPTAVRVTARRDGQVNGPISTFFARIIGHDTMSVTANATAALTGLGKVNEGELDLPLGIDIDLWDQPDACGTDIVFYPTGSDSCAGWTTFDLGANGANIDNILDGMYDGTYQSPQIFIGANDNSVEFIGGNVASALPELKTLFEANRTECCIPNNDGVMVNYWKATVVVYQDEVDGCSNVSGSTIVAGFATVNIHTVLAPPDGQYIGARIDCENIVDGQGGGANIGVIGSIPKLVQ
jgi:Flp pilus assembly protein TadG